MGHKTCQVSIAEIVQNQDIQDRIIEPLVIDALIQKGYYVVTQAIEPTYTLTGTIKIKKAASQLETPTFQLAQLDSVVIKAQDKTTQTGVVSMTEPHECIGTGQTLQEAGKDVIRCLSKPLIQTIRKKLIQTMKGK